MKRLKPLKRKAPINKISTTGIVFNAWEHNGWGDSISFFNWGSRRITGFYRLANIPPNMAQHIMLGESIIVNHSPQKKPTHISVGDEIRFKMGSGKIGRFLVSEIEYKSDPPDQFFGTVTDLKYLVAAP